MRKVTGEQFNETEFTTFLEENFLSNNKRIDNFT
jgi:hypothetical protein